MNSVQSTIKCKVLEVMDTFVTCENKNNLWYLGGATFKLPRNNELKNVKVGDFVTLTITEGK
jgi:hypothetical protein